MLTYRHSSVMPVSQHEQTSRANTDLPKSQFTSQFAVSHAKQADD